jgi:hypothetical protein
MRPALTEDGPILRCMVCILAMADWAARPELLDYELAKDLSVVHGDLVELITEADGDLFVTPWGRFFSPNGTTRIVWRFHEENFVAGRLPPGAEPYLTTLGELEEQAHFPYLGTDPVL